MLSYSDNSNSTQSQININLTLCYNTELTLRIGVNSTSFNTVLYKSLVELTLLILSHHSVNSS